MMTADRFEVLKLLSKRPTTAIDLKSDRNITIVQALVKMGFARDYSAHAGHRIPVRLRIWGITEAGRACLEQQALTDNKARTSNNGQLKFAMPPLQSSKEPDK